MTETDRDAAQVDLRTCAEEVLYLLHAQGVECLFLNPGTDSAPLQEAIVALTNRGVPIPRIVASSYESVALAAAHGYWQVTRRPQAVFVHVDVGTQNLGAMVHNLLRDRAGAIVLAGKSPYGEDRGSPGGRNNPIHWPQDVPDQAGVVRGYAKWTAELTRADDTARVLGRAAQVAGGGIPGLAYVTLSRDVLMAPPGRAELRRVSRFARPAPPAMEAGALAEVAERLAVAERPVIVSNRLGRLPRGARALARLAQLAAIPVVGRPAAVNLPTSHPFCVRSPAQAGALIRAADVILLIDTDVPWIPRDLEPAPGAMVLQVDNDPLRASMPLWTFPVDLAVTAEGAVAAGQLAEALGELAAREGARWEARRASLVPAIAEAARALHPSGQGDLTAADVTVALNELLEAEDIVVEEAVSYVDVFTGLLERTEPGTLCSAGGPGLGWALGAAVGIKMADPAARVVAVVGDGSFMFGVPTAALCLAAEAAAPFVTVVLDNDGYRASRLPVYELFPEGESAAAGRVAATRFARPPDFAALAEACGAAGERVVDRAALRPALARAFEAVAAGRPAVVDVVISDR